MDLVATLAIAVVGIFAGISIVFITRIVTNKRNIKSALTAAEEITSSAEKEARRLLDRGREDARESRRDAEREIRDRRREIQRAESRLSNREETIEKRQESIQKREGTISERETLAETRLEEIEEIKSERLKSLETIANLSETEARAQIMQNAESEMEYEISKRYYELEQKMLSEADEKAKKAIALSIQRLASQVVSETTTSIVTLPNDEMKGRLIGREGRNIRAIESATGVDLIIDDTPEAVTLSCFDPIRREIARIALTSLVVDGRIHPTRIEEAVEKAQEEVEATIARSGDQAKLDA